MTSQINSQIYKEIILVENKFSVLSTRSNRSRNRRRNCRHEFLRCVTKYIAQTNWSLPQSANHSMLHQCHLASRKKNGNKKENENSIHRGKNRKYWYLIDTRADTRHFSLLREIYFKE